jgi:hypothetical protein
MTWKCDTCREAINSVADGWVEWKVDTTDNYRKHDFRLVHSYGKSPRGQQCQYNERTFDPGVSLGDLDLNTFVGQDGLMTLLEFMSDNPTSVDQLIELTKRIHIDGYDEARGHFQSAINAGVFEPNTKPGFHSVGDIAATVEWARKQQE